MRITNNRRPGTGTAFVDAIHDEVLLQFSTDQDGGVLIAYHLYDAKGAVAGESDLQPVNGDPITIRCKGGETLLAVSADPDAPIKYRLYNRSGLLLTVSDGAKTRIYRSLRMETRSS